MRDLCSEIKNDLLLIVYELAPELAVGKTFGSLRIGQSSDFHTNYLSKLLTGDNTDLVKSRIETVTRVAKFKYKLHYKGNWELEVFINSVKRLAEIRSFLLYKEQGLQGLCTIAPSKRRILLSETVDRSPKFLQEDEDNDPASSLAVEDIAPPMDQKPDLTFKYKPVINLGDCIDIHILHRPRRQKSTVNGPAFSSNQSA